MEVSDELNNEVKRKFRSALERKKNLLSPEKTERTDMSKSKGGQSLGKTQKIFRRKSGSS